MKRGLVTRGRAEPPSPGQLGSSGTKEDTKGPPGGAPKP